MYLYDFLGSSESDFFDKNNSDYQIGFEKFEYEDSFHIVFEKIGLEFLFEINDEDSFFLNTIFISDCSSARENLESYLGIEGLDFDLNEDALIDLLGKPIAEGGGEKTLLGEVPRWVKFHCKGRTEFLLHIEFDKDSEKATKMTITA